MQKSELVNEVALRTGTKKQIVNAIVNTYHELLVNTLSTGEDVVITGFGRYAVSKRPARSGRHPQTGEFGSPHTLRHGLCRPRWLQSV